MNTRVAWLGSLALAACRAEATAALEGTDTGSSTTDAATTDPTPPGSTGAPSDSSSTAIDPDDTGPPPDTDTDTGDASTGEPPQQPLGISEGCGLAPAEITLGSIDVDGVTRQYILDLPADYDPSQPYPLVFGFHGYTENMQTAADRFRVVQEWNGQAIGIYPHKPGGAAWNGASNGPDIHFFDVLATAAADQLCIDLDRIFVVGFSAGGYFVNSLMCFRAPYVRAAAPAGAGPPNAECTSPVPMWAAHGTNDEVVGFGNGLAMRDFWLAINGCSEDTIGSPPEDWCVEYQGCDEPVVWCEYPQGHWYMEDWKNPAITAFFQRFESLTR